MSGDKDVNMTVGADSSAAESEFDKLAQEAMTTSQRIETAFREASYNMATTMKQSADSIKSEFAKVADVAKGLQTAMMAVTAVLAGGAAFKATVEKTVEMTKESIALSKALGITVTEASVLSVALDDVYVSSDTMLAANKAMTKQLLNNEGAFKTLGVATRDQNGDYRNSQDIIIDVNKRLLEFKEGTDRNIEGTKIYGKSWNEVQGTLKLTSDKLAEAKEKADSLGLTIGKENVAATSRYRAAMNDVGDVINGVEKAIGDALLPILSDLGEWFSAVGPAAVMVIKGAIGGLAAIFQGLKLVVQEVWEFIAMSIEVVAIKVVRFVNTAMAALKGDFSGANAAWKEGTAALEEAVKTRTDNMVKHAENAQKALLNLFDTPTATKAKGAGERSDGKETKDKKEAKEKSSMPVYEQELLDMKIAAEGENLTREQMKAKEIAYWIEVRDAATTSLADKEKIQQKISTETLAEIETLKKAQEASVKAQIESNAKVAESEYAKTTAAIKSAEQAGKITKAQAIEAEGLVQDAILKIKIDAISKQMAAIRDIQSAEYIKLNGEKLALENKSAADSIKVAGDVIKATNDARQKMADDYQKMLQPISAAFDKSITGMIQGTQTFQKAMSNIFQSILGEFVNMAVKTVTQWAAAELAKTTLAQSAMAIMASLTATSTLTEIGAAKVTAAATIPAEAAIAAGGAAASVAGIPIVGPALAAAAYAETMAMVMGGMAVASASGGYDIPAGVNPMTQLHQSEMVLPAELANNVRNMTGGGGDIHFHVSAIDAGSVRQFFDKHGSTIMDTIQRQGRGFNLGKAGRP